MNNLIISAFFIVACINCSAQKKLITFSAESGGILPIPIFYKGINTSSNENIKIFTNIGFVTQINCTFNYLPKSSLTLGLYYESYGVNIKEYFRFPEDVLTPNLSYNLSNYDSKNLGLRVSFGNSLGNVLKLNTGFQYGFPLNQHYGYIFRGTPKKIDLSYNYETQNPFSVFVNVAWQIYDAKKYEMDLVPEFVFQINKDDKTYFSMNQIRKLTFSLRIGIRFK
ncbi:MAG TPA: hypothetical protein PKD16_06790 [Saprospiraceae bacterium]|jgi:hypothetical protein|nr:hypothetical protein [Saprospiraceae bacterium]HMT69850.1 hypothetical protein [Saprospiraceae bacterium]